MRVSALIETLNHIRCVDYILEHIQKPLTTKMVQNLHAMLAAGAVDEQMECVTSGEYRNEQSKRKAPFISSYTEIPSSVKNLLDDYERTNEVMKEAILNFHVAFEQIFPVDNYNGRVGRLIMFKECLRYYVAPFIIDDKRRGRYVEGLSKWQKDPSILMNVTQECQDRFECEIYNQHLEEKGICF